MNKTTTTLEPRNIQSLDEDRMPDNEQNWSWPTAPKNSTSFKSWAMPCASSARKPRPRALQPGSNATGKRMRSSIRRLTAQTLKVSRTSASPSARTVAPLASRPGLVTVARRCLFPSHAPTRSMQPAPASVTCCCRPMTARGASSPRPSQETSRHRGSVEPVDQNPMTPPMGPSAVKHGRRSRGRPLARWAQCRLQQSQLTTMKKPSAPRR